MLTYLHRLSAVLFYVMGSSFFLSYILWRNNIGGNTPMRLLLTADLPFLAVALLYGGLSVYLSVTPPHTKGPRSLAWALGILLSIVFIAFLVFNFWPLIG